ncbi:type II toxin-antitoxin system VapC family toxin [Nitrobacter sp.]|uniref:type II toxin-antitoxin system VapC family toxin n=1 Tax=Nitrobacter sp. TaxID=29420 RepID=UPI003F6492C1
MVDVRKVYMDACCFIDMVKVKVGKVVTQDRDIDVWHLKRLLEANRDKEIEIYSSTISIAECTHAGENDISPSVKSEFDRLLMSGQYVRLVQLTPFIATDARDLRWIQSINLKGADSIHVASALAMNCEEFLSSNGRLARLGNAGNALVRLGLQVRGGRQTRCLPERYRQLTLPDESRGN